MRVIATVMLVIITFLAIGALALWSWERATSSSHIVTYFGRPSTIDNYFRTKAWNELAEGTLFSFVTAVASLVIAGSAAILMLMFAAMSRSGLRMTEGLAAMSQAIPVLVIVTAFLLVEKALAQEFGRRVHVALYCLGPVTVALLFPPLVNGADAISRLAIDLKYLLRLWDAPKTTRVWRVYLPTAIPQVMTGLRTSATWAVGATLLTEGLLNGVPGAEHTLGYALLRAYSSGLAERTTSAFIVATLLAFVVYGLAVTAQRIVETRVLGRTAMLHTDYPL